MAAYKKKEFEEFMEKVNLVNQTVKNICNDKATEEEIQFAEKIVSKKREKVQSTLICYSGLISI